MSKRLHSVLPQPRTTPAGNVQIPFPSDKISEFTSTSLDLLTQLLRLAPDTPPNAPWLRDQETLIQTLPPCLLHPKSSGIIPRLAATLTSLRLGETSATLCPTHKPLNPYLIRKIFLELTAECTTRIQRLASGPLSELPTNVLEFMLRMQKLNSIWMEPKIYRQAYQVSPSETLYERVESGCEACILATVGGDRGIVRDLYASILGRRKKCRGLEGWIEVVRAWGSWEGDMDALTFESTGLGREIRKCRKHLQTLRRAARREQLGGTRNPFDQASKMQALLGRDPFEEEKDEGDLENEVIDFYANMISKTSLVNRSSTQDSQPAEGIHAAFRKTIVLTDGFFQNASRGLEERSNSIYSQSVYNTSQILKRGAEERASAYRKFIGIEEDEAEPDGDDNPQFTNPFADPPVMSNRSSYPESDYDNPKASPAAISPRTTRQENEPQHKPVPHHRRPEPRVNPFTRKPHVAQPEDKHADRMTRFSDFI